MTIRGSQFLERRISQLKGPIQSRIFEKTRMDGRSQTNLVLLHVVEDVVELVQRLLRFVGEEAQLADQFQFVLIVSGVLALRIELLAKRRKHLYLPTKQSIFLFPLQSTLLSRKRHGTAISLHPHRFLMRRHYVVLRMVAGLLELVKFLTQVQHVLGQTASLPVVAMDDVLGGGVLRGDGLFDFIVNVFVVFCFGEFVTSVFFFLF